MQCIRCGNEMISTSGGNEYCPKFSFAVNDLVFRPSNCDIPMPHGFGEQKGWICPVCGRGVAPHVDVCPCRKDADVINVTTGTDTVDLSKYYTLINDGKVPETKFKYEDTLEG